ncbi:MAG: acetyltransferase [Planctomycetota bacterium]|nr:acetyltransferase [Planctomycetota bacterium]
MFGAGGHARVVTDAARLSNWRVEGCWAPDAAEGLLHLGSDADLERTLDRWMEGHFHVAVGGLPGETLRRTILERWEPKALTWANIIHPTAWVSPRAHLGWGIYIGANAVVNAGARLGNHVLINTGAIVEHDCKLDEGVNLGPRAVVGGGVHAGPWSYLALGCCVRNHLSIGANAVVGMGAVVARDVEENTMVMGVPAKPVGSAVR